MVVGFGGRVHDSQNQFFLSLETPRYFKQYKKIQTPYWEIENCEHVGKDGRQKMPMIRFIVF